MSPSGLTSNAMASTGVCCVRTWLIFGSIIYLIFGLLIAIFGGLFFWQRELFYKLYSATTGEITDVQLKNVIYGSLEEFKTVSMGMFVIGLFVIVIFTLGIVAGASFNRNVVMVFTVINGLLIIIHITIGIVYFSDSTLFTQQGKVLLRQGFEHYVSITSNDTNSQRLTYLMRKLNCCGFNSGEEFANSTHFQTNVFWQGNNYILQYPIPCCKFVLYNQPQGNCPTTFDDLNSNIKKGCWDELMKVASGVFYGSVILLVLLISMEFVTITMLVMTKDW